LSGAVFCGELLDIDGLTGGFNFQAAWTTGWLAGKAMAAEYRPKDCADSCCYWGKISAFYVCLLDGLSLSGHGKSSGELVSVMILNPTFGTVCGKCRLVGQ